MRVDELSWLPDPPDDIRARIAELNGAPNPGEEARRLATYRLGTADARRLSRAIGKGLARGNDTGTLAPLHLSVLPGETFDFIADILPAAAARHGIALSLDIAPAGTVEQAVLGQQPGADTFAPDAVLLALDHRWFGFNRFETHDDQAAAMVEDALSRVNALAAAIAEQGAAAVLCTLPTPTGGIFGSHDRAVHGSPLALTEAFNARLPEIAREHSAILLDVAHIAADFGLSAWHDARAYHLYKLPFAPEAVPLYADRLGALLGAMRGKARKCLVLDLDNTCWDGVIGDDGLENIRIGAGDPQGEAHLAVQQAALMLKSRGVILAVSSKNDDSTARLPFRNHPDMLLQESDIAVFQANWEDKATNLEAIAETLSIGLDTLVLLDDNAAERAAVRAALPMVAVPELPSDPAEFAPILLAAGYFEATGFSAEDRSRADSYRANAKRVGVKRQSRDLGDYLSGLDMRISHVPFDAIGRQRIAQLVNKSNQFNLTTQRYAEAQIGNFETDPDCHTQQTRLSDRFGDFGMIGVVIARASASGSVWEIDSWLMSCRVLGRRVDEAMLANLVAAARASSVVTIHALYVPTAKNSMVSEHFDKLGFAKTGEEAGGTRRYALDLAGYTAPELPFGKA